MIRLLHIEWSKIWAARYFRVLVLLWFIAFLAIPFAAQGLLDFLESKGVTPDILGLTPGQLPIFDFHDLWQNLAYVYKCITVLLSFIVVISVTNDLDYKTLRQNVIDGMNRTEWLVSKYILILVLATISTVLVAVLGMISGMAFSPDTSSQAITAHIEFIGAYWLHIVLFLNLSMLVSILIRRAGIVIALLIIWVYILEFIGTAVIANAFKLPGLANAFPFESCWRLVPRPIEKYAFAMNQDFISYHDLGMGMAWMALSIGLSWYIVRRRDL